jgi:hypothetical protein
MFVTCVKNADCQKQVCQLLACKYRGKLYINNNLVGEFCQILCIHSKTQIFKGRYCSIALPLVSTVNISSPSDMSSTNAPPLEQLQKGTKNKQVAITTKCFVHCTFSKGEKGDQRVVQYFYPLLDCTVLYRLVPAHSCKECAPLAKN